MDCRLKGGVCGNSCLVYESPVDGHLPVESRPGNRHGMTFVVYESKGTAGKKARLTS